MTKTKKQSPSSSKMKGDNSNDSEKQMNELESVKNTNGKMCLRCGREDVTRCHCGCGDYLCGCGYGWYERS